MMLDVLVLGELNVDIILNRIDGFPEIGKEILAKDFTATLGSSSAIFASNLATLGASVAFVGKIGTDQFGELIIDSLHAKGVHTDDVVRTSEHQTGSTIVLNYDMDRANITYPGAMEHLDQSEVTDDMLQKAKHLHVSSIFLQPALKSGLATLFARAKKLGLTTSMDPQWDPAEQWDVDLEQLLPHVDVFLPNRKELKFLTRSESLEEGIDKIKNYANTIVVKDGENGAVLAQKDQITRKAAFLNNEVTDCIGAGDSFDAGFISKYIQGATPEQCLEFGNLTGAVNTTRAGGTGAFESIELVRTIAKEKFSFSF